MTAATATRVRPEQRLHDWHEPARPRAAATVLLARDGARGLEILMTRRSPTASFAPGAYVFPGGAVDAEDASAGTRAACRARDDQDDEQVAYAVAAARESFEEVGVLLASDADGHPVDGARAAALSRHAPLDAQLAERGWRPAVERIWWFSHWITDRDLPKRFDARFFVAPMPPGFEPQADDGETFEPEWVHPADGLERFEAGSFHMIFPTIRTLRALRRFATVDALIEHCARQARPVPSCPRAGMLAGEVERYQEDEPPFGELELTVPDGRVLHALDWQHERPVALTRSVSRLTAPNGSMMTGPGTNTYLVGDARDMVVIDPGPDDAAHIERIAQEGAGRIRLILCTHSHPDHSPGAWRLQRLTGAPVAGMRSAPDVPAAWRFAPDREVADGERIAVGGCTLRAVHTPGHMSNHLCFVLEEDGLLFSGDHVLNGSTTVVDPADGDMGDYLASLARLREQPVDYILPAHGWVLGPAVTAIERLIAHRMAREAKVLGALRARDGGTLDELVLHAYDEVPPRLHPVAKRSLLAHLLKLGRDGHAKESAGRWRATV